MALQVEPEIALNVQYNQLNDDAQQYPKNSKIAVSARSQGRVKTIRRFAVLQSAG